MTLLLKEVSTVEQGNIKTEILEDLIEVKYLKISILLYL